MKVLYYCSGGKLPDLLDGIDEAVVVYGAEFAGEELPPAVIVKPLAQYFDAFYRWEGRRKLVDDIGQIYLQFLEKHFSEEMGECGFDPLEIKAGELLLYSSIPVAIALRVARKILEEERPRKIVMRQANDNIATALLELARADGIPAVLLRSEDPRCPIAIWKFAARSMIRAATGWLRGVKKAFPTGRNVLFPVYVPRHYFNIEPLVDSYADRGVVSIMLYDSSFASAPQREREAILDSTRKRGANLVHKDAFLRPTDLAAFFKNMLRGIGMVKRLRELMRDAPPRWEGASMQKYAEPLFKKLFLVEFPYLAMEAALNRRLQKKLRPDATFVSDPCDSRTRIACAAANESGGSSALVQWGMMDTAAVDFQRANMKEYFLFGDKARKNLLRKGFAANRLHSVGPVRFWHQIHKTPPATQVELAAGDCYKIVFFSIPYSTGRLDFSNVGAIQQGEHREWVEGVVRACAAIQGMYLVIKPHPEEREDIYSPLMKQYGINGRVVRDIDSIALVKWSDLVVTMLNCTTTVEAILANKPAISVNFSDKAMDVDFVKDGAALVAGSSGNLAAMIGKLRSGGSKMSDEVKMVRKVYIESECAGFVRDPADEIVGTMDRPSRGRLD